MAGVEIRRFENDEPCVWLRFRGPTEHAGGGLGLGPGLPPLASTGVSDPRSTIASWDG